MFLKSCRASELNPITEFFRLASIVYDLSGQMQEVEVIVVEQSENSDVSEDELNLLLNLYYFK